MGAKRNKHEMHVIIQNAWMTIGRFEITPHESGVAILSTWMAGADVNQAMAAAMCVVESYCVDEVTQFWASQLYQHFITAFGEASRPAHKEIDRTILPDTRSSSTGGDAPF